MPTIFKGQLWQPCIRQDCRTEPVCSNCEKCDRHCRCDILPVAVPVTYSRTAAAARTSPDVPAPAAGPITPDVTFRSQLPAAHVLCEGDRLRRVTLGETLHTETRNGSRTTFRAGVTPGGHTVVVAFGFAITAHGEDAALDDLVRPAAPLTPQGALTLLVQLSEIRAGTVHTANRDAERVARLYGGEEGVAAIARTGTLYVPYDQIDHHTPSHRQAVQDATERHALTVTSVQFEGYLQRPGEPTRTLYRARDGKRYSADRQREHWREEPA